MEPQELGEADKFVEHVKELYEKIGPAWTIVALAIIIIIPKIWEFLRDRRLEKAYREVIDTKETALQRIAQDHREIRHLLFLKFGVSEEHLLSAKKAAAPEAQPIKAEKKKKKEKK